MNDLIIVTRYQIYKHREGLGIQLCLCGRPTIIVDPGKELPPREFYPDRGNVYSGVSRESEESGRTLCRDLPW